MMLTRQKNRVSSLASLATEQKRHLRLLRERMSRWKRQTFGRPESLALAFIAGMAISASSGKPGEDRDRKGTAMQLLETSFLAWRLLGNRIAIGEQQVSPGIGPADSA